MTTEELKIKISAVVDTNSINSAKKKLNEVADSTKATTAGTQDTTASMQELKDSMESIRNLQVFELMTKSAEKLKGSTKDVSKNFKTMKEHIKNAINEFKLGFDTKHWKDLGYDDGPWENIKTMSKESFASIKEGAKSAGAAFKSMGSVATAALGSVYAKAAALLAIIGSIVALIKNGLRVSALGKSTNTLAQQAGMTTDAYQRWAFVLQQLGLQVDDMIGAQQTLLEAQVDVREGTEDIIAAFQQIGLSQEQVLGMNQQQLFEKTVEGLQNVENATERATLAYKLLSEDSKNLAPLLNLTSQEVAILANNFNTLNGAMSEGLIQTSNRLQASLGNLRAAWQGLKNTLAELVLPIIIEVVNWLTKAIAVVNLFLRTVFGLEIGGSSSSSGIESAAGAVGGYTESVEGATAAVEKLKRTTMGFDELNIVSNPNSGGSGAGAGGSAGVGGGYAGGITDSLFNADSLDMSKWQEFFAKYKNLIQDITTWGLIGVGVGVAVLGALSGNIPMVLAGLGLAGIGFAIGNVEDGTFDRLRQKFEEMNLGIVPAAMVGIGAIGAVIALFMGNIPAAIALAAMAGIGLSLGGGEDIAKFFTKYKEEIAGIVAPSLIAVGAVVTPLALMMGNIPLAVAGVALLGAGLALGGLASGGLGEFVTKYEKEITKAITIAVTGVSVLACLICCLTGNIPGAIAFGVLAGLGIAQLASGGTFFTDAVNAIKKAWEGLKTWFKTNVAPIFTKDWWAKKWDTIKQGFNDKVEPIKSAISTGWGNVKNWFSTNVAPVFTKDWWAKKWDAIKQGFNDKITPIKNACSTGWNNIKSWFSTNVAPKFTKSYWMEKLEGIRSGAAQKLTDVKSAINTRWNEVKSWFSTNVAPKFTKSFWMEKLEGIRSGAAQKLTDVKNAFNTRWNEVKSWFNTNVAPKFTTSYWSNKLEGIRQGAANKLTDVKSVFSTRWNELKNWFSTSVSPKFTTSYWSNKFGSIKEGARAAFNGVISIIEKAVNSIINKVNTVSWNIPSWVPKYGGSKFGFNLRTISIPRLATGGIATQSTLANIGENGREAILPLDNNTSWMDTLADKIASRSGAPTKIVLKVGERELGWASIKGINGITKETGEVQLQLV